MLTGRYRLSPREAKGLLCDLFSAKISLGALSSLEEDTSCALSTVVEEAGEAVRQADAVNMDESGWQEEGDWAWPWTLVGPSHAPG